MTLRCACHRWKGIRFRRWGTCRQRAAEMACLPIHRWKCSSLWIICLGQNSTLKRHTILIFFRLSTWQPRPIISWVINPITKRMIAVQRVQVLERVVSASRIESRCWQLVPRDQMSSAHSPLLVGVRLAGQFFEWSKPKVLETIWNSANRSTSYLWSPDSPNHNLTTSYNLMTVKSKSLTSSPTKTRLRSATRAPRTSKQISQTITKKVSISIWATIPKTISRRPRNTFKVAKWIVSRCD